MAGLLAIYGYLYRVDSFYEVGPYSTMSAETAVCMVLLAVATMVAVPYGVLQWIAFGRDPGAALQRALVPVAVVLLPLGGLIRVWSHEQLYGTEVGAALLVTFVGLVVVTVAYRVGVMALRMDRERDALLDELHRVNAELEDRVRARSHQLNRQRTKLALLEERDRIARDLHDRVIQRIFAAGLQVTALSRTVQRDGARSGEPAPSPRRR